jgi:hypothetical protein
VQIALVVLDGRLRYLRIMRCVLLAVVALGCSSSSESSGLGDAGTKPTNDAIAVDVGMAAPLGDPPAVFSKYCQGTLLKEQPGSEPIGSGGWSGDASLRVPAGTKVLMGPVDGKKWRAYAFEVDGTPRRAGDFVDGLVVGIDVTTDCTYEYARERFVLLRDTHFYADTAMTGMACLVPAGTEFASHSYAAPGNFTSDELEPLCGYKAGHTPDASYADLLVP